MRLWEEEWKHGNGRKDQLRSDAACSEAPAAGDFYPPPSKLHLSTNDFDICVSPERKVGTTPKRIRKTAQTWIIQEDKTVKENVPLLSRAEGGCKRTCWQHRRGITLLHSCTVETSWLNHTPRRPEHQSNNYQDSCRLKVTVLVLAELRSVWST